MALSDRVYSVVNKKTNNVKTNGDTEICEISGLCQLTDGLTAIFDITNTKVKLLSTP